MAKGIIYCMTTIVPGLVKIGKTGTENFEQRMYNLERNGYVNVVGLKRRFAIEVEDYDEKETLIHELFSKSNVPNTELFAVDIELVVQLLSSLDGKQVFPKSISKEEVFNTATDEIQTSVNKANRMLIPDGIYDLYDNKASMRVENGKFIVLKGSQCLPCNKDWMPESRKSAKIENGILMEDVICNSPSTAGWVVLGRANNGWTTWKAQDGKLIDKFRKNK
ncbi:MAG: DUF4357 domain-containing protein [Clostridia bacterium]|nr:DUF4357 domain-containing protein [Clostridia bacterium]